MNHLSILREAAARDKKTKEIVCTKHIPSKSESLNLQDGI